MKTKKLIKKEFENLKVMIDDVINQMQMLQQRIDELDETTMLWLSQSNHADRRKDNSS